METPSGHLQLGFLSDESEGQRSAIRALAPERFEAVRGLVATALSDLAAIKSGLMTTEAEIAGFGFWIRTLEASQGAYLLAERGMTSSAQALLRTAYECLFHAGALWRKPSIALRLLDEHHKQRLRQAKQMLATGHGKLHEGQLKVLGEIAADAPPQGGYTAYDAAGDAGLLFEYEERYRGLGLGGAHATLRSLDSTYTANDDESISFEVGPDFDRVGWVVGLIRDCLVVGVARFREVYPPIDAPK